MGPAFAQAWRASSPPAVCRSPDSKGLLMTVLRSASWSSIRSKMSEKGTPDARESDRRIRVHRNPLSTRGPDQVCQLFPRGHMPFRANIRVLPRIARSHRLR
jgi:hypothetical protein